LSRSQNARSERIEYNAINTVAFNSVSGGTLALLEHPDQLARLRAGLAARPDHARTLGLFRFVPWRGRLLVLRELSAASEPVHLEPGAHLRWDRRFIVDLAPAAPSGFTLGYLGQSGGAAEHGTGDLPRLIYPALPALWDEEGLAAVPHLGYSRRGVAVLPRLSFRPETPLTQAGFTVV